MKKSCGARIVSGFAAPAAPLMRYLFFVRKEKVTEKKSPAYVFFASLKFGIGSAEPKKTWPLRLPRTNFGPQEFGYAEHHALWHYRSHFKKFKLATALLRQKFFSRLLLYAITTKILLRFIFARANVRPRAGQPTLLQKEKILKIGLRDAFGWDVNNFFEKSCLETCIEYIYSILAA